MHADCLVKWWLKMQAARLAGSILVAENPIDRYSNPVLCVSVMATGPSQPAYNRYVVSVTRG